jgi:phage-related protein
LEQWQLVLLEKIGRAGAAVVKFLRPVATFVAGAFKLVFGAAFKFIVARASGWLKSTLDIIHGVTTAFSGIITFLEGVFTGNWKKAWTGVKTIFKGAFEALVGFAKRPLNQVIGLVNSVISGLNGIKIPSWVPKLGGKGINLPKIPMLARGTDNWSGGIAQVHEKGGEIIDLPRGTRVYPHDKSVQMARNQGNKTYKIEKFADTIVVREEADIDKIAEKLAEKLEAIPA